jgi:hypothetical protein
MTTIETSIEADDQRKATIQLPADAKPGSYRALILVFDEPERTTAPPTMADFPQHDIPWPFPEGYTFRREDLYENDREDHRGRSEAESPDPTARRREPGPYRAVVVLLDPKPAEVRSPLTFSAHDVGPWPEGFTVRREEIYGDDGR